MPATLTHINFDIVQRSRGNCAVKIMAYDMCAAMTKHDGAGYDFRRKRSELVHLEIMLPEGAPVELYDPEALANACELAEKRSDSQTGRLLLVTCPRECPEHLRIELARTIAQPYVDAGMGVAWAYHNPRAADGSENPHIHFFLTTRAVTPEGLARKKSPEWDRQFREKLPPSPEDPKPKNGSAERQRICDRANTYFAKNDLQIHLDPRRLEQRGIDRPPEPDAPRKSWQQWRREGADPEMAPAPVARVLDHRRLRRELAEIEESQRLLSFAGDERIVGENQKGRTTMIPWEQDNVGYEPLLPDEKYQANMAYQKFQKKHPDKAKGMDVSAYVQMRQAEFAKSQNKETKMQNKPVNDDSRPVAMNMHYPVELWMEREGGLDALSQAMRDNAAVSFEHWVEDSKTEAQKVKRKNYGLRNYCNYVQEKFAERRAAEMKGQTAKTSAPNAEAKTPSQSKKAVRPRHETEETKREFVSYVHKLLSEHYEIPDGLHEFVKRIDISKESGQAVLSLKSGAKLIDTGSEITTDAEVNEALAAATVATAHARGWSALTVTGSDAYRHAIAKAAALHLQSQSRRMWSCLGRSSTRSRRHWSREPEQPSRSPAIPLPPRLKSPVNPIYLPPRPKPQPHWTALKLASKPNWPESPRGCWTPKPWRIPGLLSCNASWRPLAWPLRRPARQQMTTRGSFPGCGASWTPEPGQDMRPWRPRRAGWSVCTASLLPISTPRRLGSLRRPPRRLVQLRGHTMTGGISQRLDGLNAISQTSNGYVSPLRRETRPS